ncbi:hypothetical protein AAG176_09075 [Lacticaseibacillus paracasei]|uniref:hypothetical protein n=1 Tax=Lacticaseibacillus paracasei TaxID=1597 RepID=UPI0031FDD744
MMKTHNTLDDLNNHLFSEMERLNDDTLEGESLEQELRRVDGISKIATQIIGNARTILDGFTIQVQQTSQIEKTHRLSPCKMESPQDQLQGELDYESVHPSYLKRP